MSFTRKHNRQISALLTQKADHPTTTRFSATEGSCAPPTTENIEYMVTNGRTIFRSRKARPARPCDQGSLSRLPPLDFIQNLNRRSNAGRRCHQPIR
jgi:hypothetical protein